MAKKLYRSTQDKMISGVCGGIGEYFNVDPTLIRILWTVLTVGTVAFPGILAYIICIIVIPTRPPYDEQ